MALHPLTDLVRRAIGVQSGETLEGVIARIDESALARDPDFGPSIPFLRYLLHVDPGDPTVARLDPQIRRAEIFQAVRALSLRDCPRRPQICVFEDLHWIDRATEDYLRFFEASVPTNPLVLLVTHRPGYVPPFAGRGYTELPIDALTAEASARVATEALVLWFAISVTYRPVIGQAAARRSLAASFARSAARSWRVKVH